MNEYAKLKDEDERRYRNFGHRRHEVAFIGRTFVMYKVDKQRNPKLLNRLNVTAVAVDAIAGLSIVLQEELTGREIKFGCDPIRAFDYPIFVEVPGDTELRCRGTGRQRDVSCGMLVKSKNKADFVSPGNVYMETPNTFRRLFPIRSIR